MLRNFLAKLSPKKRTVLFAIALPVWVVAAFYLSQVLMVGAVIVLSWLGVPFIAMNEALLNTIFTALIYTFSLGMTAGLPWLALRSRTTKEDLGLTRYPSWLDLLLAPSSFIVYALASSLILALATSLLPFIDIDQVQDVGFSQLSAGYELLLAFIALVIVAPVAEEILFRGYLFGKLQKHVPVWVAILITSLLFGIVHGAWNVGIDTFVLGIVLCLLRVISGSLWPSILLHMMKNGLAFYLLFINPSLLSTLGG
ncbi:MAG TPA: type II CAAX endopeptidase family protein [Candidatus Saccharibacteria bacterium]|nr:type II CAAX endopeptidase family protein [Candidatus Saccharibacteria bacterium]